MSSKVFNLSGGGRAPESILWANCVCRSDLSAEAFCNGSSDLPYLLPATVSGLANSGQYAYIRVGPVDLSGVEMLQAAMDLTYSGTGKTYMGIFVAESNNAKSWEVPAAQANMEELTSAQTRGPTLNVSSLNGEYYVYAGVDYGNDTSPWTNVRSARIYTIAATMSS